MQSTRRTNATADRNTQRLDLSLYDGRKTGGERVQRKPTCAVDRWRILSLCSRPPPFPTDGSTAPMN